MGLDLRPYRLLDSHNTHLYYQSVQRFPVAVNVVRDRESIVGRTMRPDTVVASFEVECRVLISTFR
jgi:hypothetical protein